MSGYALNRPNDSHGRPYDSEQQGFATATIAELLESCAPHQRALLGVLAVAQIHDMDPVPLISSLAAELRGGPRLKFERLAEQMSAGVEFVDAVEEIPELLPPSVILAFQLASENGTWLTLNTTIADLDANRELDSLSDEETYVSRYVGLMLRVVIFGLVIVFVAVKIFPEFLKMLEEFGLEAPVSLRLLIKILDLCVKLWFLIPLIMVFAIPFCLPGIRKYLRRWSPLTWRQPLVSLPVERRRSLALIAQTGRSLKSVIGTITGNPKLRNLFGQFGRVNERMEKGETEWNSLAAEKVISRRDADALTLTTSPETQSWLLQWSANNQRAHQATRSIVLMRTVVAVVNIALGLFVALTCIAVFMTLLSIMASLV